MTDYVLTDTFVYPSLTKVQTFLQLFKNVVKFIKVRKICADLSDFGALLAKCGTEPLPPDALPKSTKNHVED